MSIRRLCAGAGAALLTAGLLSAQTPAASAAPSADAHRYIVKFTAGQAEHGRAALRRAGAETVLRLTGRRAVAVEVSPGRVDSLRSARGIAFVERDRVREPLAESTPYGVSLTQADTFAPATPNSRTVCVIDSGYALGHEDLPGSVTGDDDPGGTGPWDVDPFGHGTHVAGTIASVDNELGVIGVNPGVRLHIVRVFGDDGAWAYSSDLVAALDRCAAAGSDVVNMSLGGDSQSRLERSAFDSAYRSGILPVAAAGNDGNRRTSYPAGYDSVMSVAAVDKNSVKADFSQANKTVEIAAPGVDVLSTVGFLNNASLTAGGGSWTGHPVEFAGTTPGVTGDLVDGGLCDASGSWNGAVVLCRRGSISFAEKVANVQSGGGVAAVIYNNVAGEAPLFTLGENPSTTIPAIGLTAADGEAALGSVGQPATVVNEHVYPASGYEAWSGTSMATPHVAGIAAKIWACAPGAGPEQIRSALTSSTVDLGRSGRDPEYGYGLVQARSALDALTGGGC